MFHNIKNISAYYWVLKTTCEILCLESPVMGSVLTIFSPLFSENFCFVYKAKSCFLSQLQLILSAKLKIELTLWALRVAYLACIFLSPFPQAVQIGSITDSGKNSLLINTALWLSIFSFVRMQMQ